MAPAALSTKTACLASVAQPHPSTDNRLLLQSSSGPLPHGTSGHCLLSSPRRFGFLWTTKAGSDGVSLASVQHPSAAPGTPSLPRSAVRARFPSPAPLSRGPMFPAVIPSAVTPRMSTSARSGSSTRNNGAASSKRGGVVLGKKRGALGGRANMQRVSAGAGSAAGVEGARRAHGGSPGIGGWAEGWRSNGNGNVNGSGNGNGNGNGRANGNGKAVYGMAEEEGEEEEEEVVTMGDLMDMVRDAEQNVQQLNALHAAALSELAKASTRRESLQEQVKLMGARLEGTQRQLQLLGFAEGEGEGESDGAREVGEGEGEQQQRQQRTREKELEAQVAAAQQRLEEKVVVGNRVTELQREVVRLQQRAAEGAVMEERLRHAERRQAELEERLEAARGEERRALERSEEMERRVGMDVAALRAQVERMESELADMAHVEGELREVAEGNVEMEGEVARLQAELAQREGEVESVVWAKEGELQLMRAQLLKDVGEWQERAWGEKEARESAEEERGNRQEVVVALREVAEKQEKVLLRALKQLQTKLGEAVESRDEVVKEAVREKEREIASFRQMVQALQAQVEEREGEVTHAEGQAEELRKQLAEAESAAEEWERERARVREAHLREAEAVGRETEEEARMVVEGMRAMERARMDVAAQVAALKGAVEERERSLAEEKRQREELWEQQEELQREVQGAQARLRGAERAREEAGVRGRERLGEVVSEVAAVVARGEELGWVEEELARLRDEAARFAAVMDDSDRLEAWASETGQRNEELRQAITGNRERAAGIEAEIGAERTEREAERGEWARVGEEREELVVAIESLRAKLVEADASMQAQQELYEAQGRAFEEGLAAAAASVEFYKGQEAAWWAEKERIERKARWGKVVPAGELPWEYWSTLLLKVDELLLKGLLPPADADKLRAMVWRRGVRVQEAWDSVGGAEVVRAVLESGGSQRGGVEVVERGMDDAEVAVALRGVLRDDPKDRRPLHVVHIAAEMAPVAKVGGLADVVTGLSRALQQRGHLVEVVLPKYDCMDYSRIQDLKHLPVEFSCYFDGQQHPCKIWRGMVEGLPVYFLEPQHPARLFWRGTFYGCADDFRRFSFFCRAALEFLWAAGKRPDIIHSHDWQTALVAPLYHDVFMPQGMSSARLAFTCHNFEYQGTDAPQALTGCGLDPARHNTLEGMRDNYAGNRINALKGGIVYSDVVTTVSPTYAMEVRGPEYGRGLQVTLQQHAGKFRGVLNGIDAVAWDPRTDALLHRAYGVEDAVQGGKAANKAHLRALLGLSSHGADAHKPLVVCVTRLVPQKGVHLIRHAIFRARERGAQFVLLGSSPVPDIQYDFESIAQQMASSGDVRLVLKYDEHLSHLLFAAADLAIIPSIFEPCGLTQLIAMRYGAIPLVRRTGGLADSVFDVDDDSVPMDRRNGFSFTKADVQSFNGAFDRAISSYYERREWWQELVVRAMSMDFGWGQSSEQYEELYLQCMPARVHE
ncbi:hypothetical protein CLOP_g25604 [Closterium sp. NIES-67]|nr:hypothetical protein CLOP_g25604 [Closterium sp. NIES-67]